jgi:hypothetical protein
MWIALEPDRVIAVLSEVPAAVLWSSLVHEEPALTEVCRMSSEARAALRVAVRVWEAVLVLKSLSLVPLSVDMSTLLKLIVGAVVSRV